jgi:hypothetical protein
MELYDLDNDPRPKASQAVAAKKRARAALEQGAEAPIAASRGLSLEQKRILLGAVAALLVIALLAMMTYQLNTSRPVQVAPTAGATEAAAVNAFTPAQEQQLAEEPTAAPLTFSVYDAPNGAIIGPVEQDRLITPVAHYGAGWVQVDVQGSGRVWLRTADAPGIAIVGPDLQPKPAAPAQTGQGDTWTPPAQEEQPAEEQPAPTAAPASDPQATPPLLYQPETRAANLEPSHPSDNPGFDLGVEPGMEPTPVR